MSVQMELFREKVAVRMENDSVKLLAALGDGKARTRRQLCMILGWTARHVREVAEFVGGKISRAPGIEGFRLTSAVPVEEWNKTYGAAWRKYIRNLSRQYAAQMRFVHKPERKEGAA